MIIARAHTSPPTTRLPQGAVCAGARQTRDGETLTASAAAGLHESRTSRAATRRDGRSAPRERGEMRVPPLRFSRAVSRTPGQVPTGSRRAVSAGCRSQHRCHRERVNVPRRVSSCCRRVATRVSVLSRRAVCVRSTAVQRVRACARAIRKQTVYCMRETTVLVFTHTPGGEDPLTETCRYTRGRRYTVIAPK